MKQITQVGAFNQDTADIINDNFAALAGAAPAGELTDAHILVGNGDNLATDVAMSGDAAIANTGAVTVTGINGAAVTADGTEIDAAVALSALLADLPTENVAAPAIWNDNGVLKVGTLE